MRAHNLGGRTVEVPLFASEAATTLPLSVTFVGSDSAHVSMSGVTMNVSLGLDNRVTGMAVPSQNVRAVRVEGARAAPALATIDYSAPNDAPYTAEEVTLTTASGLKLTGTLTMPKARPARGVPAAVTITGSGTEERDESIPGVSGYRPFRQIADTLGRRGVAVLRLDDRGAGGSDLGPVGPTSADFADDIRAGLAYLRTRRDVDGDRLALVGHSEGGMIAPMVAATDAKLRAIVLMAGPAHTGRTIIKYQQEYAADSMLHLTGARRDSALRDMSSKLDSSAKAVPWIHYFLDYDPIATAKRVKQPVLILQGATDRQVTPEQGPELAAAFRAGGNRDVTLRVFPSTNHLFLTDAFGNPSGYATLASKNVRTDVLGTLADWLATRLQ
jgi:dipeptidyl aminopeptidase/acylaminoacyl peptidase